MTIKKNHKGMRSRTNMRKAATAASSRAEEKKIQDVFDEADEKLGKLQRRERTTPYRIGGVYAGVKKRVGDGKWMRWLKDRQYTSGSTARSYMAINRTFSSSTEAALFSVVQQGLLTQKKVKPKNRKELIAKAAEGKQWTNEGFKVELMKLVGPSDKQKTTQESPSGPKAKKDKEADHESWIEFVEGLILTLEDARKNYEWEVRDEEQPMQSRFGRLRGRLRSLSNFFKLPTVGNGHVQPVVYKPKNTMRKHKHGR